MHTWALVLCAFLSLFSIACNDNASGDNDSKFPASPQADKRLTLSTPREQYLLGEPVELNLAFRNLSKEAIQVVEAFVLPARYEATLWIAPQGEAFQEFRPEVTDINKQRRVFALHPAESLKYDFRVVGVPKPKFSLAFAKQGDYSVYVLYPLWLVGAQSTLPIPSNAVRVRVKEPIGEDAKAWGQLNDPPLLTVLQVEAVDEQRLDVPLKMAEILRAHPKSGYAPALRQALSKIYFHHRLRLPQKDQSKLAEVLGITDVAAIADARLEARRKEPLQKDTPLEKVLASLQKLGVPLDATRELKAKKATVFQAYITLRDSMGLLSDQLEASWERRGDGYFLVPFDVQSKKESKERD